AQVCGYRGNTDELEKMEKRVHHDVWYIEHWSAALDLKIIIKTIFNALRGEENAY
ncbi:MAG: sugar transferase, partial [Muribaculaceae bacterium]|nr:sugar transferase [Muribaculaceae bacterium]